MPEQTAHPHLTDDRIATRSAHIAVLGLGYVGGPTAVMFAHAGFRVTGVDINEELVARLNRGDGCHLEGELCTFLTRAQADGRFLADTKLTDADVFLIAVPTPLSVEHCADLRFVRAAAESIAARLRPGALVILESTVPPGTCETVIAPIIAERTGLRHGDDYDLVHCPERIAPGETLHEIVNNDRIMGGTTPEAGARAAALYRTFVHGEILVTTAATAELVKLMENTFRDVNIALANEFSLVCERVGVDVREAIKLANRHPRVNVHQPGIGVGGHCIPVVPWFIVEKAPELTPLIRTAREVNDRMPVVSADRLIAEMAQRGLGTDATVGLIGLTYKANVGDFRMSPALEVAKALQARGYHVLVWDRFLPEPLPAQLEGVPVGSEAAVRGCDHVVELVRHTI